VIILWVIIVLLINWSLMIATVVVARLTNTNPFAGYTGPFLPPEGEHLEREPDSNQGVTMQDSGLTD
jgi:hypothetical protein